MKTTFLPAALAACVGLLAGCGGGGAGDRPDTTSSSAARVDDGRATTSAAGANEGANSATRAREAATATWAPAAQTPTLSNAVQLRVLSSPAEFVSGGDARVEMRAPAPALPGLELWLNGQRVTTPLQVYSDRVEAVVTGLVDGANTLEVRNATGVRNRLTLTNHPITGPMFSGPQQQPFVCTTNQSAVGRQPLVDSASQPGYPVTDGQGNTIGYSRDCSIESFVTYLYRNTAGGLVALPPGGTRPADMSTTTLPDGRTVDFVVRREVGSINRFLYSFAMLAPAGESAGTPDLSLWNKKLLYWFQGGVAIGHSQGTVHGGSLNTDILGQGFAIVHSSGNNTGTHYNMTLAGETAMMTKERFIERYGAPLWTVGLGGSGGAIQQYLIAQNQPGVLDGLLPVQSYPDMVTQTIHVGDCELLEYFMDATDRTNAKWRTTKNRSWLVGLNAEDAVADPLAALKTAFGYSTAPGSTECVKAWRGLTPLAMNPWYGQAPNQQLYQPQSAIAAIRWTHYDDLRNVYGVDENGAARPSWDNVGVQYGLRSLRDGRITPDEFMSVNWNVGGWKHPSDMVQEGFPFLGSATPATFDPWSRRNMRVSPGTGQPAPRTAGDPIAMAAAYTSGHVFSGKLDVPALDHRQYMERERDMHNAHQSFASRQRIRNKSGNSDNMVIWFTDTIPGVPKASQTLQALQVMNQWLDNMRANPKRSIAQNKPPAAVDSCFDRNGVLMSAGASVWDGILDNQPAGACTQAFPLYGTARTVAGAPIQGGIYSCALKSVDTALADGTYGSWTPSAEQVSQLRQIFPGGVCDYTRPDQAAGGGQRARLR